MKLFLLSYGPFFLKLKFTDNQRSTADRRHPHTMLLLNLYQTAKFYTGPIWKHLQTKIDCGSNGNMCLKE